MQLVVTTAALRRCYPVDPFYERPAELKVPGEPVACLLVAKPILDAAPAMSSPARRLMREIADQLTTRPGTALVPLTPGAVGIARSKFAVGVRELAELNLIARHAPGLWWLNPALLSAGSEANHG